MASCLEVWAADLAPESPGKMGDGLRQEGR